MVRTSWLCGAVVLAACGARSTLRDGDFAANKAPRAGSSASAASAGGPSATDGSTESVSASAISGSGAAGGGSGASCPGILGKPTGVVEPQPLEQIGPNGWGCDLRIAMARSGSFVVLVQSYSTCDLFFFDPAGKPLGKQMGLDCGIYLRGLAASDSGSALLYQMTGLVDRRFDPLGAPTVGPAQLAGFSSQGALSMAPNGSLALAWSYQIGGTGYSHYRRFDANDQFIDQPIAVDERSDDIALNGNGLIARASLAGKLSAATTEVRWHDAGDQPIGWQSFPHSAVAAGVPSIAIDDDGLGVVAWLDDAVYGSVISPKSPSPAPILLSDAAAHGPGTIYSNNLAQTVAKDVNGAFVLAWAGERARVRTFLASGSPSGPSQAFGNPGVLIARAAAGCHGYALAWLERTDAHDNCQNAVVKLALIRTD